MTPAGAAALTLMIVGVLVVAAGVFTEFDGPGPSNGWSSVAPVAVGAVNDRRRRPAAPWLTP